MIDRKIQLIISGFGWRILNGIRQFHKGVDNRSWNLKIWKRQPIIFPEKCEVLRLWRDKNGGGIAYKGLNSGLIFKSMHIKVNKDIKPKMVFEKKEIIGYSEKVKGMYEHEHWEILKKDTEGYDLEKYCKKNIYEFWIDPVDYYIERKIPYEYKNKQRKR